MIPFSRTTALGYSKQELENSRSMSIYRKYESALKSAQDYKAYYLAAKKDINNPGAAEATETLKGLALMYWNESQKHLSDYNEFEKNRKYPNRKK